MWQARVNSIKPLFEGETPCIVSLYHLFNSRCLCQWNRKKNVILIQTFTCEYLFFLLSFSLQEARTDLGKSEIDTEVVEKVSI